MQIIGAVKKHALSRGKMGCVGDIATLNVARGCAGACVFCFARCIKNAPTKDTLLVYFDLPRLLRHELDSSHRKTPLPSFVVFSTATDSFLGGPSVWEVSHTCLETVLSRGIGVYLSTRGMIPNETLALLEKYAPFVRLTVPLPSLSETYTRAWEPKTALPQERLFLIQRLLKIGIIPQIRVDPLIPFVNDHSEQIHEVMSALAGLGITEATLSFLHLRPGVAAQLQSESPIDMRRLVLGSFQVSQEQLDNMHHLPFKYCLACLRRIQRISREHGVKTWACHCQNPGLPAGRCPIAPPQTPSPINQQTTLFDP